jgi:hypothetical protein
MFGSNTIERVSLLTPAHAAVIAAAEAYVTRYLKKLPENFDPGTLADELHAVVDRLLALEEDV